MFDITPTEQVYLACGITDFRKGIDGFAAIVQMRFKLDPFSRCMFVFCNRNRNRIKILKWDGSGYWLLMKRLDRGSFKWPQDAFDVKKVAAKELRWILDGLSIEQPKAFKDRHPVSAV
jgi:transposase